MRHNRRDDGQLSCRKREMKTMNANTALDGHTTVIKMAERGGVPLKSRRQYYVSVIQPDLEYGSTAFSSSLSAREKARLFQASRKGVCAIARASPWTPTTPLLKIFGLAPLSVRFDLKLLLLTHRCVHSIASPFFVASLTN